MMFNKF